MVLAAVLLTRRHRRRVELPVPQVPAEQTSAPTV
jgi:hypothetical protein